MSVPALALRPVAVDEALGVDTAEAGTGIDAATVAADLLVGLAVTVHFALRLHHCGPGGLGRLHGAIKEGIGIGIVGAATVRPGKQKMYNFTSNNQFDLLHPMCSPVIDKLAFCSQSARARTGVHAF